MRERRRCRYIAEGNVFERRVWGCRHQVTSGKPARDCHAPLFHLPLLYLFLTPFTSSICSSPFFSSLSSFTSSSSYSFSSFSLPLLIFLFSYLLFPPYQINGCETTCAHLSTRLRACVG